MTVESDRMHGAESHNNVTRELFIPATSGYTNGTPASYAAHAVVQLADAATEKLCVEFKVPDDFVSFVSVKCVWLPKWDYTGLDMYWKMRGYYCAAGEESAIHQDAPAYGVTTADPQPALMVEEPANPLTLANLARGDYVGIEITRDATHADDTLGTLALVFGVLFTYVADQ